MLLWIVTVLAAVGVVLLLVAAGYALGRRRPTRINSMVMLSLLLALAAVPRASAAEVHRAQSYTLSRGQTINDTLIVFGNTAFIEGDVNGDLIFAGRRLVLHGTVKGDVDRKSVV